MGENLAGILGKLGTQRRIQKAWLGPRVGSTWTGREVDKAPPGKKMRFALGMACFGEF